MKPDAADKAAAAALATIERTNPLSEPHLLFPLTRHLCCACDSIQRAAAACCYRPALPYPHSAELHLIRCPIESRPGRMGNAASAVPPRPPLFAPIETRTHPRTVQGSARAQGSASGKDVGKQIEQRRKQQAAARATATISSSSEDDDAPVACSARARWRRAMEVTESLQERARVIEQQVMFRNHRCMLCRDACVLCVIHSDSSEPCCSTRTHAACLCSGVSVLLLAVTRCWQQNARRVRLEKQLQWEETENERLREQVVVVDVIVVVLALMPILQLVFDGDCTFLRIRYHSATTRYAAAAAAAIKRPSSPRLSSAARAR